MMAVKKSKRKVAPARRGRSRSFSTSQGRANFARALETTDREKTVVGFARYQRTVAALVPVEAVQMLAGQGGEVTPDVRDHITRMARLFMEGVARTPALVVEGAALKRAVPKKKAAPKKSVKKKAKRKGLGKTSRSGI